MEALVVLLAEFLTGPIVIVLGSIASVLALFISLVFELILWLRNRSRLAAERQLGTLEEALGTSSAPVRRSRALHTIRRIALAALLLVVGGMLTADLVFFEPIARLAIARAGSRTQTELDFKSASGSILLGRVVFEEVSAKRTSASKSSFDLKARRLGIKADPWALLSRPVALKAVSVETVSGSLRMPERRPRESGGPATAEEQERIRLRRRFRIEELTLKDVNITLAKGGNPPVAVSLSSVSSAPFRGHYALFDLLFRSDLVGQLDGRDIAIATQETEAGRRAQWRAPNLQAASLSRFLTRPPTGWLREGALDVHVDEQGQPGGKTDITMDWTVRMQGVRAQTGEAAGLMERTLAFPVVRYIESRDGNVDLHFKLVLNEKQFENMASLDARFLWNVLLRSVAQSIGIDVAEEPGAVRGGIGRAIDGVRGFLDRSRQSGQPSAE